MGVQLFLQVAPSPQYEADGVVFEQDITLEKHHPEPDILAESQVEATPNITKAEKWEMDMEKLELRS